ncbi:MAG TPA: hypothetical protein VH158_09145, partial [Gemmatimonadales bacterium]|nr:hypothetical protein [Gemmatimonadales bacterium]
MARGTLLVWGLGACAPATRYESPSALRGYDILIARSDSLGRALAQGLRAKGFRVRDHVTGGSRPSAYLLAFTFQETDPPGLLWLHVELADTRTGVIVASVAAPFDSLGASPAARAR